jgi:hypothetical protein
MDYPQGKERLERVTEYSIYFQYIIPDDLDIYSYVIFTSYDFYNYPAFFPIRLFTKII